MPYQNLPVKKNFGCSSCSLKILTFFLWNYTLSHYPACQALPLSGVLWPLPAGWYGRACFGGRVRFFGGRVIFMASASTSEPSPNCSLLRWSTFIYSCPRKTFFRNFSLPRTPFFAAVLVQYNIAPMPQDFTFYILVCSQSKQHHQHITHIMKMGQTLAYLQEQATSLKPTSPSSSFSRLLSAHIHRANPIHKRPRSRLAAHQIWCSFQ